jgi:hypothetical protein
MTEPSELRGDVISREAAIEALVRAEVAANRSGAGELDNTRARAYSDGEAAGLHFATNLLRALSALPSVPEPPNDAERAQRILDSIDEYAMTENFIIERIVKGLTNEGTMFGTTPWEQIDSREAMNLAVGYIESREWETIETDEELSSAPTGLTRLSENLEWEFYPDNGRYYVLRAPFTIDIERDKESYGDGSKWIAPAKLRADLTIGCASVTEAKEIAERLRVILGSSSAPTPEME